MIYDSSKVVKYFLQIMSEITLGVKRVMTNDGIVVLRMSRIKSSYPPVNVIYLVRYQSH